MLRFLFNISDHKKENDFLEDKEAVNELIQNIYNIIQENDHVKLKLLLIKKVPSLSKLFARDSERRSPFLWCLETSDYTECFKVLLDTKGMADLLYNPDHHIPHKLVLNEDITMIEYLEELRKEEKKPSLLLLCDRNGDLPIRYIMKQDNNDDNKYSHDIEYIHKIWNMTITSWYDYIQIESNAKVETVFGRVNIVPGTSLLFTAVGDERYNNIVYDLCLKLDVDLHASHRRSCDTPLHNAIRHNSYKNIQLLLDCNVLVNLNNKMNETPIHIAASSSSTMECLLLLLNHKPKGSLPLLLDWCDRVEGNTPLHIACRENNMTGAVSLLSHGALSNVLNIEGKVPRSYLLSIEDKNIFDNAVINKIKNNDENDNNNNKDNKDDDNDDNVCRLQIVSDLHIEFLKKQHKNAQKICHHILKVNAPTLVLLGDIGVPHKDRQTYEEFIFACANRWERVLVIVGNHEHYGGVYDDTFKIVEDICNDPRSLNKVILMNQTKLQLNGFTIIGCTLWSNVELSDNQAVIDVQSSLADYNYIYYKKDNNDGKRRIDVKTTTKLHIEDLQFIKDEIKKTNKNMIVLTHHCPLKGQGSSQPDYIGGNISQAFCTDLSELCTNPIKVWAYGHTHWANDVYISNTINQSQCRVVSNPRGYPHDRLPFIDDFVLTVQAD